MCSPVTIWVFFVDDREGEFDIAVELGEGLEFAKDFESHEVGLVDDEDGRSFCGGRSLAQVRYIQGAALTVD